MGYYYTGTGADSGVQRTLIERYNCDLAAAPDGGSRKPFTNTTQPESPST